MTSPICVDAARVSSLEFRHPAIAAIRFDDGREVVCHGEMALNLQEAIQVTVRESFVEARRRRWEVDESPAS